MGVVIAFIGLDYLLCFVGTLIAFTLSFRYRVVATLGKGITAQNAPSGQSKANYEAPLLKGLNGVRRTGRPKSATWWFERGNELLIKLHQINTDVSHPFSFSAFAFLLDSAAFFGEASSKSESFFAAKRRSA